MESKLSPVIIGVLIAVAIAIGILIVSMVTSDTKNGSNVNSEATLEYPVLTLSKESTEEGKIVISATAVIEDVQGIEKIVLPDGSEFYGDTVTYGVTENGKYDFTVYAFNGQKVTQSITVSEIEEISATNPYIPEGFHKAGGEVEDGFVIEDEYGNQYVWIPVETGILNRETILSSDYQENNTSASALVNSVAKYYGFYIGRFEASQYEMDGEITAASMGGKIPWTNITYIEANDYAIKAKDSFGYTDCSTSILSSYAWDTALAWIDKQYENYSSNTNYGNYSGTIYPTGSTEKDNVKNICDLAGNIKEWTTEIYKNVDTSSSKNKNKSKNKNEDTSNQGIYRVIRGGSANISNTPKSHLGYPENYSDNYWGFRLVIYK